KDYEAFFAKFKKVIVSVSVDAVGPLFRYIRGESFGIEDVELQFITRRHLVGLHLGTGDVHLGAFSKDGACQADQGGRCHQSIHGTMLKALIETGKPIKMTPNKFGGFMNLIFLFTSKSIPT
ncbi:MAG: hypothetical protein ACPGVU_21120, partial [Limisphaerales bacterium]